MQSHDCNIFNSTIQQTVKKVQLTLQKTFPQLNSLICNLEKL